ncbi:MAG: Coenzyme F420 hydrogenase/dehydrogenase, beta subunit C-terminal domain [Candidatus Gastranaerophilales bacterium]
MLNLKNKKAEKYYAVMANDDIRQKSSSGGVFSCLAEEVLSQDGYVCGAYLDINDWTVKHKIISSIEELDDLRGSKYVKSNIDNCYKDIKELLLSSKKVLFSGTPCHVAGLKSYLKDVDTSKLLTIDLVCHGTPSNEIFQKYLDDCFGKENLVDYKFRDKALNSGCASSQAYLKNGETINNTSFYEGFSGNVYLNECCYRCHFATSERVGDITLADFWGIEAVSPKINDGKGVSLVLFNNEKGQNYLDLIKNQAYKLEEFDFDVLNNSPNYPLYRSSIVHKNREYFYANFDKCKFRELVDKTLNRKFDVAILGLWFAGNYGGFLTYWALYKFLEKNNINPILIDNYDMFELDFLRAGHADMRNLFLKYGFNLSPEYKNNLELYGINKICDKVVLGSDQVWNFYPIQHNYKNYYLDFANEDKIRIAYSSSFGNYPAPYPEEIKDELEFLINRFDAVSVREKTGVANLAELFNYNDGIMTLDPVFLIPECFDELEVNSKFYNKEHKDEIFAYTIYYSEDKKNILNKLSSAFNVSYYQITDLSPHRRSESKRVATEQKTLKKLEEFWLNCDMDATIEDFICKFKNCKFMLSDSFHAVCFAIIYKKDFICVANSKQSITRFHSILSMFNLQHRMVYKYDEQEIEQILEKKIDWQSVYEILEKEKEASANWLLEALDKEKKEKISQFDFFKKYTYMKEIESSRQIYSSKLRIKNKYRLKYFAYRIFANFSKKYKVKKDKYKKLVKEC